jgi:hypothetical protein
MVAALLACAVLLAGQQAAPPAAPPATTEELPVSLNRLEVFGRKPTLEDVLGEKFWIGPTPYGGMTHQEFLEKVTPKLAQPYGAFSGTSLLKATALTLIQQWALKQAIQKFRSALTNRERDAARKEVIEAMADLERARVAAGLAPK